MTAALESIAALRELGAAQLARLESLAHERAFEDGALLFQTDDEAHELWWLVEGRVRLERSGQAQGVLGQGAMLGALSLAAVGRRACDARAEGPARLFALDRETYLRLRSDDPELALLLQEAIVRALAQDVRALLM